MSPKPFTSEPTNEPTTENQGRVPPASLCSADEDLSPEAADEAVLAWNVMADECGLPRLLKLTADRRVALAARLRDWGGMNAWRQAMALVRTSQFLREGSERHPWRADFDFIVEEGHYTKLMEGSYN